MLLQSTTNVLNSIRIVQLLNEDRQLIIEHDHVQQWLRTARVKTNPCAPARSHVRLAMNYPQPSSHASNSTCWSKSQSVLPLIIRLSNIFER